MYAGLQAQCQGLAEQLLEGFHVPGPDGSHQEHWSPHGLPQRGGPNFMSASCVLLQLLSHQPLCLHLPLHCSTCVPLVHCCNLFDTSCMQSLSAFTSPMSQDPSMIGLSVVVLCPCPHLPLHYSGLSVVVLCPFSHLPLHYSGVSVRMSAPGPACVPVCSGGQWCFTNWQIAKNAHTQYGRSHMLVATRYASVNGRREHNILTQHFIGCCTAADCITEYLDIFCDT